MKRIFYLIFVTLAMIASKDSTKLSVNYLLCEGLVEPLAIDNTTPHFFVHPQ